MKNVSIAVTVPYAPSDVWKVLTDKGLISEWLMATNFEPVVGREFRFTGTPNRFWRGYVECKIFKIVPQSLLQYSWQSVSTQTPTMVTHAIEAAQDGTKITATHAGLDATHGIFSGLLMRLMIRHGMKVEFQNKLRATLKKHFTRIHG